MCVADFDFSCHLSRMTWLVRSFLALLLAVSLVGATANEVSAGLTAEIAAAADPCCEGDCPDDPACGAACAMMAPGGMPTLAPSQALALNAAAEETGARLLVPDQHPTSGLTPDGLKRPPRI